MAVKEKPSYKGLKGQIQYVEDNIAIKKSIGKDYSFEEELVKEWRRYLPGGDKHYLWLEYTHKTPAEATKSTRGVL